MGVNIALCQNNANFIEGQVVDSKSNKGLPYVTVSYKNSSIGTISDLEGKFRLPKDSINRIEFRYIGYQTQLISLQPNPGFVNVLMVEKAEDLREVVVRPLDNDWYYSLLKKCKKNFSSKTQTTKAYYQTQTFVNHRQVELIESYYNVDLLGNAVEDLNLKTGRVGLQFTNNNSSFASLSSSKAIAKLDPFQSNKYFPDNPLHLKNAQIDKNYHVQLIGTYPIESGDTVHIVRFDPKEKNGEYFTTTTWINVTDETLIKLQLQVTGSKKHPFKPMFPDDEIRSIDFRITTNFTSLNHNSVFQHIDFMYKTHYLSRTGNDFEAETNAVLHIYDYENIFFIPLFKFPPDGMNDYRKISAIPYNEYFWENHNEFRFYATQLKNQQFYSQSDTWTGNSMATKNDTSKKRLMESPYFEWSPKRVYIYEIPPEKMNKPADYHTTGFVSDQYHLEAQIFCDRYDYGDTVGFVTSTRYDPYKSFYHLPMDNAAYCFINMYFDLVEIQRRYMDETILSKQPSPSELIDIHDAFQKNINSLQESFIKDVDHGTHQENMVKWNTIIFKELGVNNIDIFNVAWE